jgi:sugar phosphate isomerase/epimerase
MELGVFSVLFADKPLGEALDIISNVGASYVEIGCGGFLPKTHCDPSILLEDQQRLKAFKEEIKKRNLEISALSCHGNMLHPDKKISNSHKEDFRNTVMLAEKLDVECVVTFGGCPGDSENSKSPNWVTYTWPDYFRDLLKWQWEEKLIPCWKDNILFAKKHGIKKIALEIHPGDMIFNPIRLLELRELVGEEIGANLDPSHLFWQGIDPVLVVKELKSCIFHVHAKDSALSRALAPIAGVLEVKDLSQSNINGWNFKTVGYGHGEEFWKDFVWQLKEVGYDYVLSIEHEDHQMENVEGLKKAVDFLQKILIKHKPGKLWFDK